MTFRLTPEKPPYYENKNSLVPDGAYRALLNQTGTAHPVATVLANTLAYPVTWEVVSEGVYQAYMHDGNGNQAKKFPIDKTWVSISIGGNPPVLMATNIAPDGIVYVSGFLANATTPTWGIDNASIEIITYK